MRLERLARDLCVLTDWYTERPRGLTFRELGERYGMSESGAHHLVTNTQGRGDVAHLIWFPMARRLVAQHTWWEERKLEPEVTAKQRTDEVVEMLEDNAKWSQGLLSFADDRRELAKLRGVS